MKLSTILAIIVALQCAYTISLMQGWIISSHFTAQHEDYIFTANIMTWFIVRSIEKIQIFTIDTLKIDILKMDK